MYRSVNSGLGSARMFVLKWSAVRVMEIMGGRFRGWRKMGVRIRVRDGKRE